ncbi:hypothetical protein [Chitinimonas naiadis]
MEKSASNGTASSLPGLDTWFNGVNRLQSQLYQPFASLLSQPILPGWSFGNITVNEQNSRSPATEHEVVSQYSYGLQLGRLLDAVKTLIENNPPARNAEGKAAYAELLALDQEIDAIKQRSAGQRLQRLRRDLKSLKEQDSEEYDKLLIELAADLAQRNG